MSASNAERTASRPFGCSDEAIVRKVRGGCEKSAWVTREMGVRDLDWGTKCPGVGGLVTSLVHFLRLAASTAILVCIHLLTTTSNSLPADRLERGHSTLVCGFTIPE